MSAVDVPQEPTTELTRSDRLRVTEGLDLDTDSRRWSCNRCRHDLGPADHNYKESCLLAARDPREIHQSFEGDPEYSFSPDPDWCAIVEVYCPECGYLLDTEYLPPGHPPTHDVQIDLDSIRRREA
jgi:acetone carboxylase, gamma subunit